MDKVRQAWTNGENFGNQRKEVKTIRVTKRNLEHHIAQILKAWNLENEDMPAGESVETLAFTLTANFLLFEITDK